MEIIEDKVEIIVKDYKEINDRQVDAKSSYILRNNPYQNEKILNGAIEGRVNGCFGGNVYVFPIQLSYDGNIYDIMSASTFWVIKKYRKYELGLMVPEKMLDISPNYILAGVSKEAQPVYRYFGFKSFNLHRFVYVINSHFLVSIKIKGFFAFITTKILNLLLNSIYNIISSYFCLKYRKFKVVEKTLTDLDYKDIEDIIRNDKHLYRENHDKKWIEWMMRYPESEQHFYEVYKNNQLVGFFINKITFRELLNGKYKNVNLGMIVEWGCLNDNILRECDICAMAFHKFGTKTDAIAFCSLEETFSSLIPSILKRKMSDLNYQIKLDKEMFPQYKDVKNWRLRPAGGDNSF